MEWLKVLVLLFVCVNSELPYKLVWNDWSIELNRDFQNFSKLENFEVYWNVPTESCSNKKISKKVNFEEKLEKFGIKFNTGDKFRGDKIVILYDPGAFPAMIKHANGTVTKRNGGIPQMGNLTDHLKAFQEDMDKYVYTNFSGLGVIDFEAWRPIFRQNWNNQVVYRNMSIELVKNRTNSHEVDVNKTAADEFEKYAREFMEKTLIRANQIRPEAKWGFYGYPYCYGFRGSWTPHCPELVPEENNRIHWLFNASTALYPSIYVSSNLTTEEQEGFYIGKLNEAWRMASNVSKESIRYIPVYPYFWFKYNNNDTFLSDKDTKQAFEITSKYKMGGIIIWGSSKNVNSTEKCKELLNHLDTVLGPAVEKVTKNQIQNNEKSSEALDKSQIDIQLHQPQGNSIVVKLPPSENCTSHPSSIFLRCQNLE